MKDPEQRTLYYAIFGGKLFGAGLCFLLVFLVSVFVGRMRGSSREAH